MTDDREAAAVHADHHADHADVQEFLRRIQLSLQGVQYDLHHWGQLPPVVAGQSTLQHGYCRARRTRFSCFPALEV